MIRPPWWTLFGIALGAWLKPKRIPTPPGAPVPHDPSGPAPWPEGMVECVVCPPGTFVPRSQYTAHLMQHAAGERPA